jgi:hypothetical protein
MISTRKIVAATASSGAGEMMRHANLGASMASAGLLAKRVCRSIQVVFPARRTSDVPGVGKKNSLYFFLSSQAAFLVST